MRIEAAYNRLSSRSTTLTSWRTDKQAGGATPATVEAVHAARLEKQAEIRDIPPSPPSTGAPSSKIIAAYQGAGAKPRVGTPETEAEKMSAEARSRSMDFDRDPGRGLPGPERQQKRFQLETSANEANPQFPGGPPIADVAAKAFTVKVPAGNIKSHTIYTPLGSVTYEAERNVGLGEGRVEAEWIPGGAQVKVGFNGPSGVTGNADVSWSKRKGFETSGGVEAKVVLLREKLPSPAGTTGAARITGQKTSVSAGVTTGGDGNIWSVYFKGTTEVTTSAGFKVEQSGKVTISQNAEQVRNTVKAGAATGLVYGISRAISNAGIGVIPMLPGHYVLETAHP